MIYIKIFFVLIFLKLASVTFKIFKKNGLHGARAPFEVSAICVINVLLKQHPMRSHLIIYFKPFSINFTFLSHLSCQTWERMQQEQAPNKDGNRAGLDGYCKTRSKLNPSALPCPAHESIHGYGCCSKSKPTGYPDIHGYPWVYTLCTFTIIILEHFGNISTIIIWTMEGRRSGGHGRDRFDCLVLGWIQTISI
jgi:hypothetical protein